MYLFYLFLVNYSFTMYELASVRFPLNEHVCVCVCVTSRQLEQLVHQQRSTW